MSVGERLKSERERLGLTQTQTADLARTTKKTQIEYEKGASFPNAAYLAALAYAGADVRYIVTGERDYAPPEPLKAEERVLLDLYRQASGSDKAAARRVLAGGDPPAPSPSITAIGGHAAGRDVTVTKKTKRKP